jgi:hypothetical protein
MNVFLCRLKTSGHDSPNRIKEALERDEIWIGWNACRLLKYRRSFKQARQRAKNWFSPSAAKQIALFLCVPTKGDLVVAAKDGGREFYVAQIGKIRPKCMKVPWERSKVLGRRVAWLNSKRPLPTTSAPASARRDIHKQCTFHQFEMDEPLLSWAQRVSGKPVELASGENSSKDVTKRHGQGGGFLHDAALKSAIEQHSMRKARAYLEARGYSDIRDTSARESYDLACRSRNGELYVEVKGTRGDGRNFPITAKERKHLERHADKSLVLVVHAIRVSPGKKLSIIGGKVRRWPVSVLFNVARFTPTQFMVKIPR